MFFICVWMRCLSLMICQRMSMMIGRFGEVKRTSLAVNDKKAEKIIPNGLTNPTKLILVALDSAIRWKLFHDLNLTEKLLNHCSF